MNQIGSLNEKPLHAALKQWYRRDGDLIEVPLEGMVIDLVRAGLLVEFQTRGFSALGKKLDRLLDRHRLRLVHPIAALKWIVRLDPDGDEASRRISPKRGVAADLCHELVAFPQLLSHPHFDIEVLLTEEEEVWRPDAANGWRRRGFVVEERRLLRVVESRVFASPRDLASLLPAALPERFNTSDLAASLRRPRHFAQEFAYCLRTAGTIEMVGRDRQGSVYVVSESTGEVQV